MSNIVQFPIRYATDRESGLFHGMVHEPISELQQMELVRDLLQAVNVELAAVRTGIVHADLLTEPKRDEASPKDLPHLGRPISGCRPEELEAKALPTTDQE